MGVTANEDGLAAIDRSSYNIVWWFREYLCAIVNFHSQPKEPNILLQKYRQKTLTKTIKHLLENQWIYWDYFTWLFTHPYTQLDTLYPLYTLGKMVGKNAQ